MTAKTVRERGGGPGERRRTADPAVAGVAIVAGIGLLSDKIDLLKVMDLAQYWPLFLVGIGIAILLQHCDGRV